jgi:hypothetical protein
MLAAPASTPTRRGAPPLRLRPNLGQRSRRTRQIAPFEEEMDWSSYLPKYGAGLTRTGDVVAQRNAYRAAPLSTEWFARRTGRVDRVLLAHDLADRLRAADPLRITPRPRGSNEA